MSERMTIELKRVTSICFHGSCHGPSRLVLTVMSQRLISTFFKVPKGQKRKLLELQEDASSSDNNSQIDVGESLFRSNVALLAKVTPALSPNIGLSWFQALEGEFKTPVFKELGNYLVEERKKFTIYPPVKDVYSWTLATKIQDVKVIILGQDPYHGPGQAHGLAFSVRKGVAIPHSLRNIYKELEDDVPGFKAPSHGFLFGWASQGVLLLNTSLTVRAGVANSHRGKGWEIFTDSVILWISKNLTHVVFMLWGNNAKEKCKLIDKEKHLILTAAHPSPLARGKFFGCKHFSQANDYLQKSGKKTIDWSYLP